MYTFDQVLWLKIDDNDDTIKYHVSDPDRYMLYGWTRAGNFGQLAKRYRTLGEKAVRAKLPEVPKDVWDSIIAVAAHQDQYAQQLANQPESKYAGAGKWDD